MRVALYARVSSEAQEARGTIGSQVEALRARAAEDQHEIVKEFLDNGHSGARLDRPGLDALRDAAVAGAFEAVLVISPDRLARNFAYQMVVLDEFKLHGVEIHFLDTPDFADEPQSRLLTQIEGVIAEYERAKIMERNRRGKLYRSRLGEILSWKAPYGYRRVPRGPDGPAHLWCTSRRRRWCVGSSTTPCPQDSRSGRSQKASSTTWASPKRTWCGAHGQSQYQNF